MQRRLCRFKKSPEVQWNWDVQSKNCPKTVFCPGAKKTQMNYFPRKLQHGVCTQPKPVLTDVCARLHLSFCLCRFSFCIFPHFSLSLFASPSHPPPLLRGLADLGAYVFIKTAVRSSKWKGRKKKEGELQRPASCVPEDRALSLGWVSTACLLLKISLYPHATVCSARFCLVWQKRLQQAHLRK